MRHSESNPPPLKTLFPPGKYDTITSSYICSYVGMRFSLKKANKNEEKQYEKAIKNRLDSH